MQQIWAPSSSHLCNMVQSRDSSTSVLWSQPQPQVSINKTCLSGELVWSWLPQAHLFHFPRDLKGFCPSPCCLWVLCWLCKGSSAVLGTPCIYGWMFQRLSHPGVREENEAKTWKNSWTDTTEGWEEKRVHSGTFTPGNRIDHQGWSNGKNIWQLRLLKRCCCQRKTEDFRCRWTCFQWIREP